MESSRKNDNVALRK